MKHVRAVVLVALLLLVPLLSGCLSGEDQKSPTSKPIKMGDIPETSGITSKIQDGYQITWTNEPLPFVAILPLPKGATMASIDVVGDSTTNYGAAISHAETGRRRCNTQPTLSFSSNVVGTQRCSGLTAIDRPGDEWRFSASGVGSADVTISFLDAPIDGIAAGIKLENLSRMDFEIEPTVKSRVPSFDGTELWIEYTKPVGDGPFPVIIASSPYNHADPRDTPAMWTYWTQDWARRGYVAVNADVRGFGESNGCVEVWGYREQRDQVFLVKWAASQPWSTGDVGFYGQSYLGTTAMEAAVYAPEALKAIIAIAPVANSFYDWHFGGVPNAEALLSPAVGYQVSGTSTAQDTEDLLGMVGRTAGGVCDLTLTARANDPRAIYDQFYIERDFAAQASEIQAAVLYTQGFEDQNVKGAMIPLWFNALQAPKLGLFGHWLHQHPPRMDEEVLFMAWMDQFVKGKDMGLANMSLADVVVEPGIHRVTPAWPNPSDKAVSLGLDFTGNKLGEKSGTGSILLDPTGQLFPILTLSTTITKPLYLDGQASLNFHGTLTGVPNAYVGAYLYEVTESGRDLLTWGQFNVAHRFGHDVFTPVTPVDDAFGALLFAPTSHIIPAGATIELELRSVNSIDNTYPIIAVGQMQFRNAELNLPGGNARDYIPTGYTAAP